MDTSKIIKGVVNSGRYTVTAPIVKENYGIYLQIEGVELPETYQVDFSNDEHHGTSVIMIGNADGVRIPRQFIDTGKDIFAFLYWVGEDYGKTVHKFRIPNKLRPDRTEEQPTPEEQSVIDQAINALNEAVAQTAQDVIDADASAQEAAESARASANSAVQASLSESNAERAKGNAQASAESASASASASANSASQSAQIKADVEDLVDDAQGYANASAQSASASANSASQAQGYAQSASASANSASGYASQADISANTASNKASEASTSAQTASTKATEASQSATNASASATQAESAKTASQTAQGLAESARDTAVQAKEDAESARDEAQNLVDGITGKVEQIDSNTERIESLEDDRYKPYVTDTASGSIVSFPDGADGIPLKSLVVNIDPVQDLHGYDSPWVGGGGKNLLDPSLLKDQVAWNVITLNLKPNTVYVLSTDYSGATLPLYFLVDDEAQSSSTKVTSDHYVRRATGETVIAKIAQRRSSGEDSFQNYHWQLEETVSGGSPTAWTPYENICPISGWTEVDVEQSGVNVWDEEVESGYFYTSNGAPASSNTAYRSKNYIPVKPNTTYFLKNDNHATNSKVARFFFYDKNKTFIISPSGDTASRVFTVPDNAYFMRFYVLEGIENYTNTLSINYPSTDHDYHPYVGQSIPISWQTEAGTVYGGKLDVLSGVMRVDRLGLDGGDLSWAKVDSYNYGNFYVLPTPLASYVSTRPTVISSSYKSESNQSASSTNDCYVWIRSVSPSNRRIYVKDTSKASMTADEFRTAMTGVQFVYELAEPIEIQLDAHTLNSLYGQNNIFADTGDTACEYRADTKLYIERLTAPDSADMVADSNIVSGQYFMVGNSLYLATANIANGGQITVGTNCTRVSLAQALNEINA